MMLFRIRERLIISPAKLKVCLKELKETRRWLRLVKKSNMLPEKNMVLILAESEELVRIFFASVRTAEKNSK